MTDLLIRIDGSRPPSTKAIEDIGALCDAAEDRAGYGRLVVHASGSPGESWASELTVALVSKWERAVRRLERLPVTTVTVAVGDCGGTALDALLATDYRIAAPSVRLLLRVEAGATWPGLATYRLARQAGLAAARSAVLLGSPIKARDALALRLIDELTDDAPGALAKVARLAGPELAIRRQLMLDAPATAFDDVLGAHLAACDRTLRRLSAGDTP